MSQLNTMKLLGSRNMGCIVERMEWNNKMDLIAYGTEKGEVVIQRLNWQKIITFPTPGEDVRVRSLSWQTDETLLAVGYSNGKVALLDAEREIMISGLIYEDDIKKVYFTKAIRLTNTIDNYNGATQDTHTTFLPSLPPLNNIDPAFKSSGQKSFPKGSPCFLIVIMNSGKVHLLLLGALQAGSIDLTQHIMHPETLIVYDVRMNGDFNAVYTLLRDGDQLKILHFQNIVLDQCMAPMLQLALHCANILETKNYINDTLQCIVEAWETVLLEMDNKLTKYANGQPDGMMSAHFLELFLFGFATLEVEGFLTDELTDKGFRKIANSVDLSLSNLESLVSKQLKSAGAYMFFFLNTTNGFGRLSHFFEPLISPDAASEAMRACGAFHMKIFELHQTIGELLCEVKLFNKWMNLVILRLSHQEIPEDMHISPQDNLILAEYLYTMEEQTDDGQNKDRDHTSAAPPHSKFNLEKVGQYFDNRDLSQIWNADSHHVWQGVLRENECLRTSPHFVPHDQHLSLIQQRDKMLNAIDAVFRKPTESISTSFAMTSTILLGQLPDFESEEEDYIHVAYFVNDQTKSDMMAITTGWQEVLVLDIMRQVCIIRSVRVHFQPGPFTPNFNEDYRNLRFIDLQFYSENAISILLQTTIATPTSHRPLSVFAQLSLTATQHICMQHQLSMIVNLAVNPVAQSIYDVSDGALFKNLDGNCEMLAVSGSRKVATVLSERKRKMTVFEMEIEEEEDDTEMSQASLLELSKDSVGYIDHE